MSYLRHNITRRHIYDTKGQNLRSGTVGLNNGKALYGLKMRHIQLFDQLLCAKYQPMKTQIHNTERTNSNDAKE